MKTQSTDRLKDLLYKQERDAAQAEIRIAKALSLEMGITYRQAITVLARTKYELLGEQK